MVTFTTDVPTVGNLSVTRGDPPWSLTWTDESNNEDNYIVELSTDGGSTYSTEATLAAGSTSYSYSPPEDTRSYLRVVTDCPDADSTSSSVEALYMTRQANAHTESVTANATRDAITKSRTANAHTGSVTANATRDAITKSRTANAHTGSTTATATRDAIAKTRTANAHTGPTSIQAGRVFVDVLGDGLGFYEVEYVPTKNAHVTEWIYEEPINEARDFGVRLQSAVETGRIDIAVERDDTGDGTVDAQSEYITTSANEVPTHVPDIANGGAYYRVLLYGPHVYPEDHLRGLDIGFIH